MLPRCSLPDESRLFGDSLSPDVERGVGHFAARLHKEGVLAEGLLLLLPF
jgi:hypothetical protein